MEEFDNKERRRYYGIRVGDIVTYVIPGTREILGDKYVSDETYEVIDYGFMDNNRVYLKSIKDGHEEKAVAEYCQIVTKVEDI